MRETVDQFLAEILSPLVLRDMECLYGSHLSFLAEGKKVLRTQNHY